MQGTQIDKSLIENFSTTGKFSIPTLMEEMSPAVLGKKELEYGEKVK